MLENVVGFLTANNGSDFEQALFGFGDAVCVPVIEWIAKKYLNDVIEDRIGPMLQEAVLTGVEQ